jgi:hypothetical protein
MTDAVLSTEFANTPVPGYYLAGTPNTLVNQPPNVVPPYTGSNANTEAYPAPSGAAAPFPGNAADILPLASIGRVNLNLSLNSGGLTGPASLLAAMSTGAFYQNPASSVTEGAVSTSPVSTGKTALGNPNAKVAPYYGQGVVGANVP